MLGLVMAGALAYRSKGRLRVLGRGRDRIEDEQRKHNDHDVEKIAGASVFFSVLAATNLTAPINWQQIGQPTEVPNGSYSTYQFTDTHATNRTRYYKVVSP